MGLEFCQRGKQAEQTPKNNSRQKILIFKNMKKLVFGLLATILFTTLSFAQDLKSFVNDPMFKEYVNDNKEAFDRKHDIDAIKLLLKDEKIDEVEFKTMHKSLGFDTHDEFTNFLQIQSNRLQELSSKYQVNSQTASSVDIRDGIKSLYDSGEDGAGGNFCQQKYANCMIIANATAVGLYIACGSTTVFYALCAASVAATHWAMMDNCRLDYLECGKTN